MKRQIKALVAMALAILMLLMSACGSGQQQTAAPAATQAPAAAPASSGGDKTAEAPANPDAPPEGWVKVKSFLIVAVNHITGQTALTGELRKSGYELGKEEANAAGGVNGLPIEILYEDDQGTNPGAVAATQKALSQYEAVALMIDRSPMVNAVHPIIEEAGIPTFFGATAASINDLGNPWFFRMRVNDADNAKIMAKFMVDNQKKTKIAALYAADTFGEGGNTETKKALKELYNVEPVVEQKYTSGTKDFTAQLLAIKSAGADIIYAWGTNSEDNAIILRQFKQLGLDQSMDYIGSAAYASAVTIELAGENVNGVYSVYDFAPQDTRTEFQAWYKGYQDKYGAEPDFWCLSTYDGIKLIADAATRAGIVQKIGDDYYMPPTEEARTKLAEAMRATADYAGAAGPYTADKHQNMIHNSSIVQIKDQKLELVDVVSLDVEK